MSLLKSLRPTNKFALNAAGMDIYAEISTELLNISEKQEKENLIEQHATEILDSLNEEEILKKEKKNNILFQWVNKLKSSKKVSKQKLYLMLFKNLFGKKDIHKEEEKNIQRVRTDQKCLGEKIMFAKMRVSGFNRMLAIVSKSTILQKSTTIALNNGVFVPVPLKSIHKIKYLLNLGTISVKCFPINSSIFKLKDDILLDNFDDEHLEVLKVKTPNVNENLNFKEVEKINYKVNLLPIIVNKEPKEPSIFSLNLLEQLDNSPISPIESINIDAMNDFNPKNITIKLASEEEDKAIKINDFHGVK